MSVQDRYQRPAKELRAMEARKRHAQAELQRSTAITTICACANSADRDVGGAFANDVLVNLAISDDPDDQRFAQRMLNR